MKKFNMEDNPSSTGHNGMTHFVDLPTGGLYYPEGHPLCGVSQIEVKMMTTREEDVLTNQSYIDNEIVIDKLLESIILKDVNSKDMYDSDKMAVLLSARIEAYGPNYDVTSVCPYCSEMQEETIDLNDVVNNVVDSQYEKTDAGTTIVELPKSKKVVEFKNLLPKDMNSIEKTVEKMKKLNVNTSFNIEFFKRIVVSVDGETNKDQIFKFVESIRIMDSRFLTKVYNQSMPRINTTKKTVCASCGKESEGGLPIQANFFFPEF